MDFSTWLRSQKKKAEDDKFRNNLDDLKLSSRQAYEPENPEDIGTISARHPYEVVMPANQIGPFPTNMSAGAPRGEIAYTPREYAREAALAASQISPVYHGSPYKFSKFKNEAIGTGEGAQAFGYGHYMTESPEIAKGYANTLTRGDRPYKIIPGKDREPLGVPGVKAIQMMEAHGPEARNVIENFIKIDPGRSEQHKQALEALDKILDAGWKTEKKANVYEATLHKGKKPGEYEYLDWNGDVNRNVANKFITQLKKEAPDRVDWYESLLKAEPQKYPGNWLYSVAKNIFGSPKGASAFLKRAGIDGIKYPAGSLSGVKSDKFNYVVFDPEDIAIEAVK